jgi:hypothetical protein
MTVPLNYKIRDAAENEKIDELRELLKNPEADVGVLDWREYTIIQCAAIKNKKNLDTMNLLVQHRTCTQQVLNHTGMTDCTAVQLARQFNRSSIKEEISIFLTRKGVFSKETLLSTVSEDKDLELVKRLLDNPRADINYSNRFGYTPILNCANNCYRKKNFEILKLLLNHRSFSLEKLNKVYSNMKEPLTVLDLAIESNMKDNVSLLVSKGAKTYEQL